MSTPSAPSSPLSPILASPPQREELFRSPLSRAPSLPNLLPELESYSQYALSNNQAVYLACGATLLAAGSASRIPISLEAFHFKSYERLHPLFLAGDVLTVGLPTGLAFLTPYKALLRLAQGSTYPQWNRIEALKTFCAVLFGSAGTFPFAMLAYKEHSSLFFFIATTLHGGVRVNSTFKMLTIFSDMRISLYEQAMIEAKKKLILCIERYKNHLPQIAHTPHFPRLESAASPLFFLIEVIQQGINLPPPPKSYARLKTFSHLIGWPLAACALLFTGNATARAMEQLSWKVDTVWKYVTGAIGGLANGCMHATDTPEGIFSILETPLSLFHQHFNFAFQIYPKLYALLESLRLLIIPVSWQVSRVVVETTNGAWGRFEQIQDVIKYTFPIAIAAMGAGGLKKVIEEGLLQKAFWSKNPDINRMARTHYALTMFTESLENSPICEVEKLFFALAEEGLAHTFIPEPFLTLLIKQSPRLRTYFR
jgi:hypothetical protein